MILAETSKWIDHLRDSQSAFGKLLNEGGISAHPLIIGEIAMGSLRDRAIILKDLSKLLPILIASDDASLWTRERRLLEVAEELHRNYKAT